MGANGAEQRRPWRQRVGRALYGDRPGPLEIVLGPNRYLPILMRVEGLWVAAVGLVGIVALALPRPSRASGAGP